MSEAVPLCGVCGQAYTGAQCPRCTTLSLMDRPEQPLANEGAELKLMGTVLGERYKLDRLLGRGGMGSVFSATQLVVERQVAVKVLSPAWTQDANAVARFRREAALTSKLKHPNSIRVYDFGTTPEGLPYLVMEQLEGQELSRELRTMEAPMPISRAVSLTSQILRALGEAHDQGIIHRDLKPSNIFIERLSDQQDHVKVMDFGIATVRSGRSNVESPATLTGGMLVGTPPYMSPEQIHGEPTIDARSDLYSVGIILFEMLTGRTPFRGKSDVAILLAHTTEEPPAPSSLRPELSGHPIEELVLRLLCKHPDGRPVSALHTLTLLQRAVPTQPGVVTNPTLLALTTGQFAALRPDTKPLPRGLEDVQPHTPSQPPPLPPHTSGDEPAPLSIPGLSAPRVPRWALGMGAGVVLAVVVGFAVSASSPPAAQSPEVVTQPEITVEIGEKTTAAAQPEPAAAAPAVEKAPEDKPAAQPARRAARNNDRASRASRKTRAAGNAKRSQAAKARKAKPDTPVSRESLLEDF